MTDYDRFFEIGHAIIRYYKYDFPYAHVPRLHGHLLSRGTGGIARERRYSVVFPGNPGNRSNETNFAELLLLPSEY
jgi:hypothetical protein